MSNAPSGPGSGHTLAEKENNEREKNNEITVKERKGKVLNLIASFELKLHGMICSSRGDDFIR